MNKQDSPKRRRLAADDLEVPIFRLNEDKPHPLSISDDAGHWARTKFSLIRTHPLQGAADGGFDEGAGFLQGMEVLVDRAPELELLDGWKEDDDSEDDDSDYEDQSSSEDDDTEDDE